MIKHAAVNMHERLPRLTCMTIWGLCKLTLLFCCSNKQQRGDINRFLKKKNYIYQLRFAHWLNVNRFKVHTFTDINFRPFTSLDNEKHRIICQHLHEILTRKSSSFLLHKVNETDILIHIDPIKGIQMLKQQYQKQRTALSHEHKSKTSSIQKKKEQTVTQPNHINHQNDPSLNINTALKTIIEFLEKNQINYFLMSGTLLGLIRDKQPIKNDDIDIGVYANSVDFSYLCSLLNQQQICVEEQQFPYLIKLDIDGVSIDLFFHFEENDSIWHGSIYHRWYNKKFQHGQLNYLGKTYSIPEDFTRYLNENYGDWETPVSRFSIYLDCPNYRPQFNSDGFVFLFKNWLKHQSDTQYSEKLESYLQQQFKYVR